MEGSAKMNLPVKQKLRYGWEFAKQHVSDGMVPSDWKGLSFSSVLIPHDWLIQNVNDLYEDSVGFYRTVLHFTDVRDYYTALRFEGVYMDSSVYVNGQKVFEWKYGYSTFEVPVDEYLVEGDNEVVVKVVHLAPNSRWYSGAGIYRPVYLIRKNRQRFLPDGIYIHNRKTPYGYESVVTAETDAKDRALDVRARITDAGRNAVTDLVSAPAGQELHIRNENVKEWDVNHPNLYYLEIELYDACRDVVLDKECIRFGYRTLTFTTDKGFFLNGTHVKIQGVALHHDLGCLGSAVNETALRRQLRLMKEMGANAIRSSHNMPSAELIKLCDEMGFLLQNEAFDCWKKSKTPYDYARFFEEWAERDVASWIRRDRNAPSVIMWSIGNEIYDTHADESGKATLEYLIGLVNKHDPHKNAYVTFASNYLTWENTQKCADVIKLTGYNYTENLYEEHHEKYPDWIIYGSETASIVQSRGVYHFPLEKEILADDDRQCSSLLNSITSWGAKSIEYCLTKDRDMEFSLGQFIWTGIDYIGEPTPYHTKNSYFGQVDTAGFLKDSYYMYQAAWTDYKEKTVLHIFPYWDFNEGQLIDIRVCSNAPSVELFLNGETLGKKAIDRKHGDKISGDYKVPYRKGELKAVAYDEEGNIIKEEIRCSFSDACKIQVSVERDYLRACDETLAFLAISVLDKEGNEVCNANNRINISVEGEGMLLGTDNGDSTDTDEYHAGSRRMFNGKLLAVIRSNGKEGNICVSVTSLGLKGTKVILPVRTACTEEYEITELAVKETDGINTEAGRNVQEKYATIQESAIPVRKLEIVHGGSTHFSPEHRQLEVSLKVLPQNATTEKIVWRVCDDAGVDSLIAEVKPDMYDLTKAVIVAKGDGLFRIRVMCENVPGSLEALSQLECSAKGLGTILKDPYGFIYASQYDAQLRTGNGNERGVSTSRNGYSFVAFKDVDFGKFGSDEVTLPIFSFDGRVPIRFWEGIPYEEGSRLIKEVEYTLPGIWNTYVPDTFSLGRRLKGITTFALEFNTKIHLKGFSFTKQQKAYAYLTAAEADAVYGDSYIVEGSSINGIGNNVTLVFEDMDFSKEYAGFIKIKGYTPNEVNNINLLCKNENGTEEKEALEFLHTKGVKEVLFKIKPKTGKCRISFVFLPGSSFDFEGFCFVKGEEL